MVSKQDDELTEKQLKAASSALKIASTFMAEVFVQYCDDQYKEFMLCGLGFQDPRQCLSEGKEVTRCITEWSRKVGKKCYGECTKYFECLEYAGKNMVSCRKQQRVLDACLKEKMGTGEPKIRNFSITRVHNTDRPKPPPRLKT